MPLSYAGGFKQSAAQAVELEAAGLDMVWVAEAYGFDGVSLMGYLAAVTERVEIGAAILPIYTRTPTLLAMTAAGVDALSDGRCVLGLGASGPQVIEGWHGVPYTQPVGRTPRAREVCCNVWTRERVTYEGRSYTLPLPPDQGTGLGKPLKLITTPVRERVPIYVASLGPNNVRMTAEIADGWLPIFYLPEKADEVWGPDLAAGAAKRPPELAPLESWPVACWPSATMPPRCATWPGPCWRSTSGAWAQRVATSTTTWLGDSATRPRPRGSRICTSPAGKTRRPRRSRPACSRPPPSVAPRATCATASPRSGTRALPCST